MTKRLISLFLTLVLLAVIPLSGRYYYNPYTGQQDYYEAAGDITLGDIGDLTLTGLATGNILYYNGTAWVNLATGANAEVLTLAAGVPSWAAGGAPAAHAASHMVAGADLVDHDQLTNYLAAQHLTLPNTLAAVLTDHNLLAHTALGLFDQSADVDHDATTNWVANKHINWTAAASNFSTSENFALAWDDAADYAEIVQMNAAGTADRPLINIDDDRTGLTADTLGEATIVMNAAGTYAFYIQTGQAYFADDTTQIEDVFMTWADAADHMFIDQNSESGIEDQALVRIEDSREGATVDEISEASLRIDGEGYGLVVIAKTYFEGIFGVRGVATFEDDMLWTWDAAGDHAEITQTNVTGTDGQPLIHVDDDRTGAYANTADEATIVVDAAGTYALSIPNGYASFADRVYTSSRFYPSSFYFNDDNLFRWGTGNGWLITSWDANGTGDGVFSFLTTSMASANQTEAFFFSNLNPDNMTDHDDYLSPTFVITNDEGADANDYAGVVIGERAQANVKVAHYFDFYAMTGASDGSVASADELPAIFRFGPNGTGIPGYSTTGGDVLMEGSLEIDGNQQNAGYNRFDTIYWIESFDHGIAANRYSQMWDITSLNVQGNGTNTIDTTPSHITLTTDNNAAGDNEGTITYLQIIDRSRLNRSEWVVDLGQTANTQFYMGWNTSQTNAMVAAADEYVIVFFDVSDNANWQIKVGDGATEDVFTSAVAADTSDIRHEIWVEADGTVHWRVNGTELDITGTVDNLMTANGHYLIVCQAQSVTGAAAIVAEMCYVENEKAK